MTTFVTLSSGQKMPMIGLGTWKSSPGQVELQLFTPGLMMNPNPAWGHCSILKNVFGLSMHFQVKQAVVAALDCGYRHIDCAAAYGNEQEVGEALALRIGPGKVRISGFRSCRLQEFAPGLEINSNQLYRTL